MHTQGGNVRSWLISMNAQSHIADTDSSLWQGQFWQVPRQPVQTGALPEVKGQLPIIRRGQRGLPNSQQSKRQQKARALAQSPMTKAGARFAKPANVLPISQQRASRWD
jgi:hypothetical protein